jgi:hypothetical protein
MIFALTPPSQKASYGYDLSEKLFLNVQFDWSPGKKNPKFTGKS